MQIRKKNVNNTLTIFLIAHLVIWTLVPSISNNNLPLDTIEVLAWGSNLDWGYGKHPPLGAFVAEVFYQIFGNQDWSYYFLSQLFVVSAFYFVFKLSEDFFKDKIFALISVFLLEGIYFYNFTTPEFNVNICQLPFWALTVFYFWRAINQNENISWLLFGFFAALGVLSKYTFFYLIISIFIFFIYIFAKNKKFNLKWAIPGIIFIIVIFPHLIWLIDYDYATIRYAIFRSVDDPLYSTISGFENLKFLNHIFNPIIFLAKQLGILVPFFLMLSFIISRVKINLNLKDKKVLFLISITILPIILVFFTSLITGSKIRTMWMTPFYLFTGVLFVYIFKNIIILKKLKYFLSIFLILFIFSPVAYYYVSVTQSDKRTSYAGKEIAKQIKKKYDDNFDGKIRWIVGDVWHGGNLSYHLESRPKWFYVAGIKKPPLISKATMPSGNVSTIGFSDSKILKKLSKICKETTGMFHIIENIAFCIHGSDKK